MTSMEILLDRTVKFTGLLLVLFVSLKLAGVITWSWIWIMAPIWIPVVVTTFLIVMGIICYNCCKQKYKSW